MGDDAQRRNGKELPTVAIACQGGGIHASFAVGVLSEILKNMEEKKRFELVGLSGTSAGRCAR
jgi:NTE family protein